MMQFNNDYSLKTVAIYCRLSREDEDSRESSSIQSQKEMLTDYAKSHSWRIYDYYIDDGYTGTNFNRPAFKRMIKDIEQKKINIVITKDLSRLGRNYLDTGRYTEEFFPMHNIRYIAINDNYDYETINKLMLRNQDDFMKYFFINIHRFYNAQILDNYKFRFDDGTIVEFTLEKVR